MKLNFNGETFVEDLRKAFKHIEPINHGTIWDGRELRQLDFFITSGMPMEEVAKRLGRTLSACSARWLIIRTARVFFSGKDTDTVKTFAIKEKK